MPYEKLQARNSGVVNYILGFVYLGRKFGGQQKRVRSRKTSPFLKARVEGMEAMSSVVSTVHDFTRRR